MPPTPGEERFARWGRGRGGERAAGGSEWGAGLQRELSVRPSAEVGADGPRARASEGHGVHGKDHGGQPAEELHREPEWRRRQGGRGQVRRPSTGHEPRGV